MMSARPVIWISSLVFTAVLGALLLKLFKPAPKTVRGRARTLQLSEINSLQNPDTPIRDGDTVPSDLKVTPNRESRNRDLHPER